jgi:hypothetical protein
MTADPAPSQLDVKSNVCGKRVQRICASAPQRRRFLNLRSGRNDLQVSFPMTLPNVDGERAVLSDYMLVIG